MAGSFVVDASLSAAWLLQDEATPASEAALEATATSEVWVPSLWTLEIANLLLVAERRRRITAAKRQELAGLAAALRLRVDREPVSIVRVDDIASAFALSAYDAVYLELAIRRGLPLATVDKALGSAMEQAGVAEAAL